MMANHWAGTMVKPLAIAALTALLLSSPPLHAQPFSEERTQWNQPHAPYRVVGPVYDVGTAGLSAYLIVTPKGHILIDGGLPESASLIEANIAALGFRLEDIRFLLNSHAHFDHAGGLAALKAVTRARLLASAADRPDLERGFVDYGPSAGIHFPPVKVDGIVSDGQSITLGGLVLTAHLTPGHTKGCTTWTLPAADHRFIFYCSTSVAGNELIGPRAYPGIVASYRRSLAMLGRMKADIFLGFHPEFNDRDEKIARRAGGDADAFVDPSELSRYVSRSKVEFEREYARQVRGAKTD